MNAEPLQILLVEDNPGDVDLIREALRESGCRCALQVAPDGDEAVAFLKRRDRHASAPRPDLILLDLNLPKMDGREVLAVIQGDPNLKPIPTVILTSSERDVDLVAKYGLRAVCYVKKPLGFQAYVDAVKRIVEDCLSRRRPTE